MKRLIILLSLFSMPLFAAEPWTNRLTASVLASEISNPHELWSDGTHGGFGFALAYAPSKKWDVELMAADKTYRGLYTSFIEMPFPGGIIRSLPVTTFRNYRVHPLDLFVSRHFRTDASVSPYVRLGARYVDAPNDPPQFPEPEVPPFPGARRAQPGFQLQNRASTQAGAGLRIRLTPRTALRVEVARLLRAEETSFDASTRAAAGLAWHF